MKAWLNCGISFGLNGVSKFLFFACVLCGLKDHTEARLSHRLPQSWSLRGLSDHTPHSDQMCDSEPKSKIADFIQIIFSRFAHLSRFLEIEK